MTSPGPTTEALEVMMSYANILVSLDLGEAAPDKVRLAAGLADRFEATLTGAAAAKVPAPVLIRDIQNAQAQYDEAKAQVRAALDHAEELFQRYAVNGIRTDWCSATDGALSHFIARARSADLLVVGRCGPNDPNTDELGVQPGPVLMEAGRPVLVVPPRIEALKGARILVAWKDSVEARRAVSGALPFIRHADQVFVVSTGEEARLEGAEEVARHLARHGASVTTHLLTTAISDSDEILRFAQKQNVDLIVTGAYGHSRLGEWDFGGVTRDILRTAPICCLMAH